MSWDAFPSQRSDWSSAEAGRCWDALALAVTSVTRLRFAGPDYGTITIGHYEPEFPQLIGGTCAPTPRVVIRLAAPVRRIRYRANLHCPHSISHSIANKTGIVIE